MIGQKIKAIRERKNLTQQEFADYLHISSGYVSELENGLKNPSNALIFRIEHCFAINPEWMKNDKGEMFLPLNSKTDITNRDLDDFVFIKQVSGQLGAGGHLLPNNEVNTKLAFKYDWIKRKGDPNNMSIIHVSGDSMEPTLLNGDLILVDHNRNYIDPSGGIYAITIGNEIFAKRIQVNPQSGGAMIISDNTKYPLIEVEAEQIKINGKVIWFGREL